MSDNPLLRVAELIIKYGLFTAVNKVFFQHGPGDVHCLLGPNGAGKTLTIKAIVGLVKPVEGYIDICGKNPLTDINAKNCIGYVAEDLILIESLIPREHTEFAATVRGVGGGE